MLHRMILICVIWSAAALPLRAEVGAGLVIGNQTYDNAPAARRASALLQAVPALESAGFAVVAAENQTAEQMRDAFATFLQGANPGANRRLVIALAGNFAHSGGDVWLLGRDAATPGLARADAEGLRVGPLLDLAAQAPGGAVVVLVPNDRGHAPGPRLTAGLPADIVVPQGVTLVRGTPDQATAFLRAVVTEDEPMTALAARFRFLRVSGFVSPFMPFLPEDALAASIDSLPAPVDDSAEMDAWRTAQEEGSRAAFEGYLQRYPDGRFAADARAEIARIDALPENREAALNLSRDDRREIQRQLTLLGHSTRGIDGIFGPGTRGAIRGWQEGRGLTASGFIDADQRALLAADAARRQAEIDEQERQQQLAREQADRAFWLDSGASAGDEAALRAYLARYPQGLFADVARERIASIEAERARAEERRDREAWDTARAVDTETAYRTYLANFPNGLFAAQARNRIAELAPPAPEPEPLPSPVVPDADIEAARAEEESLGLNTVVRNLIELHLELLRFPPGRIDGVFDASFRNALRDYQASRGLPVTGYLTRPVLRQLRADGLPFAFE